MDKVIISGLIGDRDESLDKILKDAGVGENFTANMMREYLAQNPEGDIIVELNTIGGDVIQGFEIYDMLEAEKKKGRTVKMYGKQFDSIGSIIFLAGSEGHRYSYKGASPLIHNSWLPATALGDMPLNAEVLRAIADDNEQADSDMLNEYAKAAGREKKREIQELMRSEAHLTDAQLLDLGFANKIISESTTPQAAKLRALAFNSKLKAQAAKQYADCILIQDGKVLLIQRALDDDFEAGTYAFPGGKIEEGELPEAGAVRELFEETGLRSVISEPIAIEQNADGSLSHYYAVIAEGSLELEEDEIAGAEWFSIDSLPENIIKGQVDRYNSLIQKSIQMSEKVTALEKRMNAMLARLGLMAPKAMLVPLEGGETELFVYSEDGELEGKRAVIADGGEPTDQNAPEGTHKLRDGRSITVGPDGVITSVEMSEDVQAMDKMKEEITALKQALNTEKAKVAEKETALSALQSKQEETKTQILALQAEFESFKKEVPGDDGSEESKKIARVQAMKKAKEDFAKMKPSERRIAAMKIEAKKSN